MAFSQETLQDVLDVAIGQWAFQRQSHTRKQYHDKSSCFALGIEVDLASFATQLPRRRVLQAKSLHPDVRDYLLIGDVRQHGEEFDRSELVRNWSWENAAHLTVTPTSDVRCSLSIYPEERMGICFVAKEVRQVSTVVSRQSYDRFRLSKLLCQMAATTLWDHQDGPTTEKSVPDDQPTKQIQEPTDLKIAQYTSTFTTRAKRLLYWLEYQHDFNDIFQCDFRSAAERASSGRMYWEYVAKERMEQHEDVEHWSNNWDGIGASTSADVAKQVAQCEEKMKRRCRKF